MLMMTATLVEDPAVLMERPKALLRDTILRDLDYRDAPLEQVIDDLFAQLQQQNGSNKSHSLNKVLNDPVPKFTFKSQAVSARDLLAEMENQTGYTHQFNDQSLFIFHRKPLPHGEIPYGVPVPGKPGYVTSPHAPESGYVDLRGFQRGTEVKCPYTNKIFLVP